MALEELMVLDISTFLKKLLNRKQIITFHNIIFRHNSANIYDFRLWIMYTWSISSIMHSSFWKKGHIKMFTPALLFPEPGLDEKIVRFMSVDPDIQPS